MHLSVHISVNFFLLSHLLRDHWSDFFETCTSCSPSGLVKSAWIWFWSVNKCGRHPAIFDYHGYPSPPKPLEEFLRNFALNCSQCLDMSARKRVWSINKYGGTAAIFKIAIYSLLNTVQGSYALGKCQGILIFFKVRELSGNFILCQGKMKFCQNVRELYISVLRWKKGIDFLFQNNDFKYKRQSIFCHFVSHISLIKCTSVWYDRSTLKKRSSVWQDSWDSEKISVRLVLNCI